MTEPNEAALPGFGQIFTTDAQGRTGPQNLWGMEGAKGLTTLEYAAIHLRVEHPDLPGWLNEMIRKARRDEFAKAALMDTSLTKTSQAWAMADSMLAEEDRK